MKKTILLLTLALALNVSAQVPSYVPTSGLVGWWPFTGNAIDSSGNGNNGVNNGGLLTNDRFGNPNSAYYFSSSGCNTRIDVSVNTSSITTELTISVWAMNVGSGCLGPRLLEFYPGSDGPGQVQWGADYGLGVYGVGSYTSSGFICSASIPFSADNVWTNIVYTNDGSNGKFYKDGVLQTTVASTGNPIVSGNGAFGRMNHPANDAYNGNLDDIGIWNRALTQCEISNLFNASLSNIITLQPINQTAIINTAAQFSVATSGTSLLQWQQNSGTSFVNLANFGQYSGVTTDTLTITNVTLSQDNYGYRCIVSGGCPDTSNVAILSVVTSGAGINEFLKENLFSIFPNPATNKINIKAEVKLIGSSFTIYDNIGNALIKGKITGINTAIDLSNLSNGIYLLSVGEHLKQTFKLIKSE